jgi:EAL and modified HD-GYP domain-containing signal transduction protein
MFFNRIYQWLIDSFSKHSKPRLDQEITQEESARDLFVSEQSDHTIRIPSVGLINFQPILDRIQRIIGYEICLNETENLDSTENSKSLRRDADRAMLAKLKKEGSLDELLPFRKGFIQMGLSSLKDDNLMINEGASQHIVYIIEQSRQQELELEHIDRIDFLIQEGFRFAVEPAYIHVPDPNVDLLHKLFARMDYFVLDFAKPIPKENHRNLDWIKKHFNYVNWYARNIRDNEDFQSILSGYLQRRFVLFHGNFVSFGDINHNSNTPKISPQHSKIIHILRALRKEIPHTKISDIFRSDPVLSFRLLRFVNSPIIGLARHIHSIEECIVLLGREVVFRWLSLMLFGSKKNNERAHMLLERSLIRAKFLELLGVHKKCHEQEAEHLFLTGLFSLLDLVLGHPLRDIVHPNDLPASTRDALIINRGPFMLAFDLVLAYEQGQTLEVKKLADQIQISTDQLSEFYLQSVSWSQNILSVNSLILEET